MARVVAVMAGSMSGRKGQRGQGTVEYALILVLIAIVVIGGMLAVAGQLNTVFGNIVTALTGVLP